MSKKSVRTYRKRGLDFSNLQFLNRAERDYVQRRTRAVAQKIRELRTKQGFSQERLAELTSTSVSTIKFIEQNQRTPSLPMLLKLIYLLDRSAKLWE